AAVVECDHILAVANDKHRPTWRAHHLGTQAAKLAQRSHTDEWSVNDVHGTTPSQPRHNLAPGSRIRQITEAASGITVARAIESVGQHHSPPSAAGTQRRLSGALGRPRQPPEETPGE